MKNQRRARRLTLDEATLILKQKSKRGKPAAAHSFVTRIAMALDVDLARLAQICDNDPIEFLDAITASRGELIEFDVDPMWRKLYDHVSNQIAQLIAIRMELDAKMAQDRQKELHERLRQET